MARIGWGNPAFPMSCGARRQPRTAVLGMVLSEMPSQCVEDAHVETPSTAVYGCPKGEYNMQQLMDLVERVMFKPIARRVHWNQPQHPHPVSLVLCSKHLQQLLTTTSPVLLNGETFSPELCDWCYPQSN